MGKLTITTFLSLDGVTQAPGGPQEDPSGGFSHGGWVFPYMDEEGGRYMGEVFDKAEAFLLGRLTYQIFAAYWPKVTDPADPIASALNRLPKYVASKSLNEADWANSSIVRDAADEVGALKERIKGELQVHGSAGLAQTLIAKDLIDEYRLLCFPVALGAGKRLFGAGTIPAAFRLVESRTTAKGVIMSRYERAGRPGYGSF